MGVPVAVAKIAPFVIGAFASGGGDGGSEGGGFRPLEVLQDVNRRVTIDGESPASWALGRVLAGPNG